MTVGELIRKLEQYEEDLPICIDDYMGFVEASEDCIEVSLKNYICFPFTEGDQFPYVNLKSVE